MRQLKTRPRFSVAIFQFLFLWLVPTTSLGLLPDGIFAVPRSQLAAAVEKYPKHECAAAIRDAEFSADTVRLLNELTRTSGERPERDVIADSLEESGHPLALWYREGLLPLPEDAVDPQRATERLFGLLKLNPLPAFVGIDPGKRSAYFFENILWGLEVTPRELRNYETQIAEHRTLEHLTVEGTAAEINDAVRSQALRNLTSIALIENRERLSYSSAVPQLDLGAGFSSPQFPNLRRLSFRGARRENFTFAGVFNLFGENLNLNHLELENIPMLSQRGSYPVQNLNSLVLHGVLPRFEPSRIDPPRSEIWAIYARVDEACGVAVRRFFRQLNPQVESIRWTGFGFGQRPFEVRAWRVDGVLQVRSQTLRDELPWPVLTAFDELRDRGVEVRWLTH